MIKYFNKYLKRMVDHFVKHCVLDHFELDEENYINIGFIAVDNPEKARNALNEYGVKTIKLKTYQIHGGVYNEKKQSPMSSNQMVYDFHSTELLDTELNITDCFDTINIDFSFDINFIADPEIKNKVKVNIQNLGEIEINDFTGRTKQGVVNTIEDILRLFVVHQFQTENKVKLLEKLNKFNLKNSLRFEDKPNDKEKENE